VFAFVPLYFLFFSYFRHLGALVFSLFPNTWLGCGSEDEVASDRKDESGVEIWSQSHGWVMDQKMRMKARSIFEVCCGSDDKDKVARMNL